MGFIRKNIYTLLIIGFVAFSLWPSVYELTRAKLIQPDREFELVHNFYTDYNFYLSRIRQGIEGNLLVREKYTSEPHTGSLFQVMYLVMGWVGTYVRVPWDRPGDIYHIARLVFALTVLALIAEFCKKAFKDNWALVAFLLAVTASTWPKLVLAFDGWRFGGYMPWFTVMDSLQRITFIPHLLAGQALIIFLLHSLSDQTVMAKSGNWIFLGFITLVLGIIFPPGLLVVGVSCLYLIIFEFFDRRKHVNPRAAEHGLTWFMRESVIPRAMVGLISLPSIIYFSLMFGLYPWRRLVEFDVLNPVAFDIWEYILAMGPVLPLGVLGLAISLIKREKAWRPAQAWILSFLTLFIGFHFVPQQHPLRFAEMLPHVPLAILTAYLFYNLKKPLAFIPAIIIILGLGTMYSSWLWQRDFTNHKLRATYPLVPYGSYVLFPLKNFIEGMAYLRAYTPRGSVVLSMQTTGNYIPVYAGNTAYYGHANTVKYEEKKPLVEAFFAGKTDVQSAYAWIKYAGINYIFFGPQEKEVGKLEKLETTYPFLYPVFNNPQVVIYEIRG